MLVKTFAGIVFTLIAASASLSAQECATPGNGEFEYLVGSWREEGSKGTLKIEKILAGCGYMETWRLKDFNAVLLRTYDGGSGKWHLSFAANDLVPQVWEGSLEEGTWYFVRDWMLNSEPRRSRTFWQKLSSDRFERVVEQSVDGGRNWRPHVSAVYRREDSVADAEMRTVKIDSEGWRLVGDLTLVRRQGKLPAVLMLNKANGDRSAYKALASALAKRGIASLRIDLRAHGESDNLARFGPPFDEKMRALLVGSDEDITAATRYLSGLPEIDASRIGVVGASYSGEQMAVAARKSGYAKAYVALSPGSFSDASIAEIDRSGSPWFFIRSVDEIALMKDVFEAVSKGSSSARMMRVSGKAHASDLLSDHPELNEIIAVWFDSNL